jgi:hypothetical protein
MGMITRQKNIESAQKTLLYKTHVYHGNDPRQKNIESATENSSQQKHVHDDGNDTRQK